MRFVSQNCNLNLRQMVRSEEIEFVDCLATSFKVSEFSFESFWKGKSKPIKVSANIISIIKKIINNEIIIDFIFQNLKKKYFPYGWGSAQKCLSVDCLLSVVCCLLSVCLSVVCCLSVTSLYPIMFWPVGPIWEFQSWS